MSHDYGPFGYDGYPQLLPASPGITSGAKLMVLVCFLLSIMQGSFVAIGSATQFNSAAPGFGRVWPADAVSKIPLPPANLPAQ